MSLELQVREADWLRRRLITDRRKRLLDPRTRARALLAEADVRLARLDGFALTQVRSLRGLQLSETDALGDLDEPLDEHLTVEWQARVDQALSVLDRIARGSPGSVGCRLALISAAAELLGISDADLDTAAYKIAVIEDAVLELGEGFIAQLRRSAPAPVQRREPRSRPAKRHAEPLAPRYEPAPVRYDDSALCEVLARLPSRPPADLDSLDVLGELDDHLQSFEVGPKPPPIRAEALLVVAAQRVGQLRSELERAVADKARRLTAVPSTNGSEPEYVARSADVDAELVQPVREALGLAKGQLIRVAVRVRKMDAWPGGRDQRRHERALRLAAQVGARTRLTPQELELAAASLGHAKAPA